MSDPDDGQLVQRASLWRRALYALAQLFSSSRVATAEEVRLQARLDSALVTVEERDAEIAGLKEELEKAKSTVRIAGLEIEKLTMVSDRDRMRVQAETAIEALKLAKAEAGKGEVRQQ
jgi:hypothetical protein